MDELDPHLCVYEDGPKWRECVLKRLDSGEKRFSEIESHIIKNTESIDQIKKDTGDLVEIFQAVKGGLAVLQALGKVVKWGSGIVVAIGALWTFVMEKWTWK